MKELGNSWNSRLILAGGGSNVDSDVVDSKTGVAHNDDPSDWGKTSYGVGLGGSFCN